MEALGLECIPLHVHGMRQISGFFYRSKIYIGCDGNATPQWVDYAEVPFTPIPIVKERARAPSP